MENNFIDMIRETPMLHSKKCRFISFMLLMMLRYSVYLITIMVWMKYDFFIAFFILILSFIVVGIIRAKLRNIAIPLQQQEYQYSDKEIADWYTAREICNDALEKELERI